MIGLDTNVLVRYMAQDDPIQSKLVMDLIERRLTERDPGFVSIVAMTETAWVLERPCGLSGAEIARAIERTLQSEVLVAESEQEIFTATVALRGRAQLFRRRPDRRARRQSQMFRDRDL